MPLTITIKPDSNQEPIELKIRAETPPMFIEYKGDIYYKYNHAEPNSYFKVHPFRITPDTVVKDGRWRQVRSHHAQA